MKTILTPKPFKAIFPIGRMKYHLPRVITYSGGYVDDLHLVISFTEENVQIGYIFDPEEGGVDEIRPVEKPTLSQAVRAMNTQLKEKGIKK